ncbi:MAG: hypothetical protein KDC87_11225 [Planctomycetes bacterium]|nr:hypothetical protein [Planctomycetota bacterium]
MPPLVIAPSLTSDQRRIGDRRRHPTPALSRYTFVGRRRGGRRDGERARIYVDRRTPTELLLGGAIVLLSGVDLVLTLLHLQGGGDEANPAMAWALAAGGEGGFAWSKVLATGFGALVLLLHSRFPRVRGIMFALVVVYLGVMVWHAVVAFDRAAG